MSASDDDEMICPAWNAGYESGKKADLIYNTAMSSIMRDNAIADAETINALRTRLSVAERSVAYWQDLACANRKVAENAQAQRDKLAVALKWLDAAGNLGLDKHARIRETLKECGK